MDGSEPSGAASDLIRRMNAASASKLAAELRSAVAGGDADVRSIGAEPMQVDTQRSASRGLPSQPAQHLQGGRRSLEPVQVLSGHSDRVWAVAWSPNGEQPSELNTGCCSWLCQAFLWFTHLQQDFSIKHRLG